MKLLNKRAGGSSIFIKLLAGYLALTLVIILLTGVVSYVLLREYLIRSNKADLLRKAEALTGMIKRPGGTSRVLDLPRIGEMQTLTDAQVIYVDSDMKAKAAPSLRRPDLYKEGAPEDFEMLDVIDALDQELLRSLLDGNTAVDVRKLDFMKDQMVFAGAPIKNNSGVTKGALLLCRPLRAISVANRNLIRLMAIAFLISGAIASAIAYLFSRRITQPLTALNRTAGRMSEGFYGERVAITQNDEIGQLGTTLNLLSARLSTVINNLSEEKTKLEKVLSSIGEGIIAVDRDGRVVHHNRAALELLSAPPRSDMALSIKEQLTQMLHSASEGDERVVRRFKVQGRVIEAAASPIHTESGATIGAVCLLRDISEAERLEQMRRDYIANISHELRTPLTGIRGMAEPLLDGYIETEAERQESYRIIYQESLRLEKLIGEMLDLSRLQEGRIQLELEPMEPEGILEAAGRRMKARAAEGEVELTVEAEEGLALMGNEDRILQVLIVLLDNALSFTPPGGKITLSARREGERVALAVSDTGCGIDPVDLPYIWERFYKADKSRMRTSGTGLGLSIAKLVVELMGGEIRVKTKPGEGATFTFTLPKAKSFGESK